MGRNGDHPFATTFRTSNTGLKAGLGAAILSRMSRLSAIDYDYLSGLRRYEDAKSGISEEFVPPSLGPGRAWGILSLPLTGSRSLGWVICPSLGKERSFLRRLEAVVARGLAAAGFPVLRIRGGCDAGNPPRREISLPTRLTEADDAVETLSLRTRVTEIGALGALGGGMVAALTAGRLDLSALALIEPVVRGRQYLREALRMQSLSDLVVGGSDGDVVPARARTQLAEAGCTTIRGFELRRDAHDDIASVDLEDITGFRGRSLLVAVTPSGEPTSPLQRLHDRWLERGVASTLHGVRDPLVVPFGESYLRDIGPVRRDTRLELDRKLAVVMIDWLMSWSTRSPTSAVLP